MKPENKTEHDVPQSRSTVGLGIEKCKHCGSIRYQIQLIYVGFRQRLFVVECGYCKYEIIPVNVDYFMPDDDLYETCKNSWNAANVVTNVQIKAGGALSDQET